jgi:hypothetical protein
MVQSKKEMHHERSSFGMRGKNKGVRRKWTSPLGTGRPTAARNQAKAEK